MKNLLSQIILFSRSSRFTLALITEIVFGVFFTTLGLWIFLKLADSVIEKEVIFFDDAIIRFIYSFRSPLMTSVMKTITFFGGEIFLGIAIITTILLLLRKHKKDAAVFSFILFFGISLTLLLKDFFHRPRPDFMPLIHESSYSFPSGHAMNSFVFFISLSYFIFHNTRNRKLGVTLSILSVLLVLLIGLSRVYLGVHYPSDVIAGYAAGFCWFVFVLLFEKTIQFFRLFQKFEAKKKY